MKDPITGYATPGEVRQNVRERVMVEEQGDDLAPEATVHWCEYRRSFAVA